MSSVSSTTSSTSATASTGVSKKKIQGYTQTIYDVVKETLRKARSIGTLTDNGTQLTVKSTLSGTSRADTYSFSVSDKATDIGIVVKASKTSGEGGAVKSETFSSVSKDVKHDVGYANVQVLDSRGKVVADSSASATLLQKQAYQNLRDSKMTLDKGKYFLKVSFSNGVISTKKSNYAVELLAGTAKKSYTTTQLSATSADSVVTESVSGNTALSIIDASQTSTTNGITFPSTGSLFDYYS